MERAVEQSEKASLSCNWKNEMEPTIGKTMGKAEVQRPQDQKVLQVKN